jgi:excisionase family DNA binding protein
MSIETVTDKHNAIVALEPSTIPRKTYKPAEFARAVGTGINRVWQLVREGRIRHIKHGRRIVIPISEVDAFLERESQGGQ